MKERIKVDFQSLPDKFGIIVDGEKQLGQDLCQFFKEHHGIEWLGGGFNTTDSNCANHEYEVMLITKPQGQSSGYLTYGSIEYVKHNGWQIIDVIRKTVIEFSELREVVEYNGVKYDRDEFMKALADVKKYN